MKVRNGFVSNSSSSSFAIFGAAFDWSDRDAIEEKFDKDFDDLMEENDLSVYTETDCGDLVVGMTIDCMNEDETLRQFKARVAKKFKELFGEDEYDIDFLHGEYNC